MLTVKFFFSSVLKIPGSLKYSKFSQGLMEMWNEDLLQEKQIT